MINEYDAIDYSDKKINLYNVTFVITKTKREINLNRLFCFLINMQLPKSVYKNKNYIFV